MAETTTAPVTNSEAPKSEVKKKREKRLTFFANKDDMDKAHKSYQEKDEDYKLNKYKVTGLDKTGKPKTGYVLSWGPALAAGEAARAMGIVEVEQLDASPRAAVAITLDKVIEKLPEMSADERARLMKELSNIKPAPAKK